jgi:DHA2 family multidrug resistance protein
MAVLASVFISSGWFVYSRLDANASPGDIFVPQAMIMFGMMLIFPLLAAQAFRNLRADERDEGAGMFNFVKTLGFSFGVTFVGVMLYRGTPANWTRYVGNISDANPAFTQLLDGPILNGDLQLAAVITADELARQSGILATTQLAQVLMVIALAAMPLALLLQRQDGAGRPQPPEPTSHGPHQADNGVP